MKLTNLFILSAAACFGLQACAAGNMARSTAGAAGQGLKMTSNAALRAAGIGTPDAPEPQTGASVARQQDEHWSEEWVWKGDPE